MKGLIEKEVLLRRSRENFYNRIHALANDTGHCPYHLMDTAYVHIDRVKAKNKAWFVAELTRIARETGKSKEELAQHAYDHLNKLRKGERGIIMRIYDLFVPKKS